MVCRYTESIRVNLVSSDLLWFSVDHIKTQPGSDLVHWILAPGRRVKMTK